MHKIAFAFWLIQGMELEEIATGVNNGLDTEMRNEKGKQLYQRPCYPISDELIRIAHLVYCYCDKVCDRSPPEATHPVTF